MARQLGSAYELDERIGRGAMGEVWRGRIIATGEVIAAKLLHEEHTADQEVISRFVQERSILVSLDHPNLVRVRDLVAEGSSLAIVMDLVEGSDLRTHLRARDRLTPLEAVELMVQVFDALQAAHAGRVLHRDVKPENVLLDLTSGAPQVRLSDFGISRLAEGTAVKVSQLIGTAEYLAPETIATEVVSPAGDIYAAGIMLYELLAGRTPFVGKGQSYAIVRRQVDAAPPRLDELPPALWAVISQLLSKDPGARPDAAGARALLESLMPALVGVPGIAAPPLVDAWEEVEEVRYSSSSTELRGIERPDALDLAPTPAWAAPVRPGADDSSTTVVDRPVVRLPQPELVPEDDDEEERPNRNALYAGLGVAAIGLVVALVLLMGGGGSGGKDGGGVALDANAVTERGQQSTAARLVSLDRSFTLTPTDDGTYTLQAELEYEAGLPGMSGPVVEFVPRGLLALTPADVDWTTADGQAEPVAAAFAEPAGTGGDKPSSYTLELPVMASDADGATFSYELSGIQLPDGITAEEALSTALEEVSTELATALEGTSELNRELWLMGITGLEVVADPLQVGEQLHLTVAATMPSGARIGLFGAAGPLGGPATLLAMLGSEDNLKFDVSGLGCSREGQVIVARSPGSCLVQVTVGGTLAAQEEVIVPDTVIR